ncbi:MAG: CPBP family intramembrane metalloprotease [Anaerolineae bacterium]|nr:CPBP family intramembrane metalloprotease [Anaerolineae bacterium]
MTERSVFMQRRQQIARLGLFLACGMLVFVLFSHYFPVFSGPTDFIGRIVVALAFLVAALLFRRSERYHKYWRICFAFFTALAAISLDYKLGFSKWLLPALRIPLETPAGWAIDKLESSALSILVVLLLTLVSGDDLASLYLRRGNLRLGLTIGLVAFVVMMASAIPVATLFFNGRDLSWGRMLPWMPWVLIFVLANAFNEELLFRGLFFGRLQPFLGRFAVNMLMAVPFTLMHSGVGYTADILIFIGMLFPLSLAWGWTLQKTDSLWGSILFHAAMDIPIAVGIFSNL